LGRTVSKHLFKDDRVGTTCLSDENRGAHIGPARTVVSKLRENCSSALLGRGHHPEADYDRDKGKDVNTAKDSFCQWKVLRTENVEGCHRDHCNPGEKGALPALGSVGGVVDHDQRLHQAAYYERIHGNDREPRNGCKPS